MGEKLHRVDQEWGPARSAGVSFRGIPSRPAFHACRHSRGDRMMILVVSPHDMEEKRFGKRGGGQPACAPRLASQTVQILERSLAYL